MLEDLATREVKAREACILAPMDEPGKLLAMAVPQHLLAEVMMLSEQDRLELAEHIVSTSADAHGSEDGIADRAGLRAALEASAQDVAVGRTRPAHEWISELRAGLK